MVGKYLVIFFARLETNETYDENYAYRFIHIDNKNTSINITTKPFP
jgi:hypothetical protein